MQARTGSTRPASDVQAVRFVLLLSRQGKVRLAKWYTTYTQKERAKVRHLIPEFVCPIPVIICCFPCRSSVMSHRLCCPDR